MPLAVGLCPGPPTGKACGFKGYYRNGWREKVGATAVGQIMTEEQERKEEETGEIDIDDVWSSSNFSTVMVAPMFRWYTLPVPLRLGGCVGLSG